jgi:hypothetical protein
MMPATIKIGFGIGSMREAAKPATAAAMNSLSVLVRDFAMT